MAKAAGGIKREKFTTEIQRVSIADFAPAEIDALAVEEPLVIRLGFSEAALFDAAGKLIDLKEDVGRHNAVDKLVGGQLLAGRLPPADKILFLSGRASLNSSKKRRWRR